MAAVEAYKQNAIVEHSECETHEYSICMYCTAVQFLMEGEVNDGFYSYRKIA